MTNILLLSRATLPHLQGSNESNTLVLSYLIFSSWKDFDSIYSAVCRGSHQGIDEFFSDLMTAEGDDYNCMANYNRPIMMLGKAVTKERGGTAESRIRQYYGMAAMNFITRFYSDVLCVLLGGLSGSSF